MPLEGLHIENFVKQENVVGANTSLTIDGVENTNVLVRSAKLTISVQDNLEPYEGGCGYWSVCINDIKISGYPGRTQTPTQTGPNSDYIQLSKIWMGTDGYIHPENPLKDIEYEPSYQNNGGNNIQWIANIPYDVVGGLNDNRRPNKYYKKYPKQKTIDNGDKSIQAVLSAIDEGTTGGTGYAISGETEPGNNDWQNCEDTYCFGNLLIFSTTGGGQSGILFAAAVETLDDFQTGAGFAVPSDPNLQGSWEFEGEFNYYGSELFGANTPNNLGYWKYVDQSQAADVLWDDKVDRIFTFNTDPNTLNSTYPNYLNSPPITPLGNKVEAIVLFENNVSLPAGTDLTQLNIDFDGRPIWVETDCDDDAPSALGLPTISNTIVTPDVIETGSKAVEVKTTITKGNHNSFDAPRTLNSLPFTIEEINNGANPDHDRFIIKTNIKANRAARIADIEFSITDTTNPYTKDFVEGSTPSGYFKALPRLAKNYDNVTLKLKSKTKTNGRVTSCIYELHRKNNLSSSAPNVSFTYTTKRFLNSAFGGINQEPSINKIRINKDYVSSSGEDMLVSIYGTPGATFGVTVNESEVSTHTHADGLSTTDEAVEHGNDVSILPRPIIKTTTFHGIPDFPVLTGVIGKNGIFKFTQKIPENINRKTEFVTAPSNTREDIVFKSLNNVNVGDRLYTKSLKDEPPITVGVLNPDGDNVNELDLSANITAAAGDAAFFKSKKCYTVNLVPDLCSRLMTGILSKKIYQYLNPVLTINNNITGTDFKISHDGGVATGFSNGQDYTTYLTGEPFTHSSTIKSKKSNYVSKKSFVMILDLHDAAHNWTAYKYPSKNNVNDFWTITDNCKYSGTEIEITNMSISALSSNTITFSYDVEVTKWGSESTTLDLTLNNLFTFA